MTKTMREKMADAGMTSYIVQFENAYGDHPNFYQQYWASDANHAREQHEDATSDDAAAGKVIGVMTQDEYEISTGNTLAYGRSENF